MLVRNIDAFVRAFGIENAPIVMSFSTLPWQSDEQRDSFIKDVTGINLRQANSYGS